MAGEVQVTIVGTTTAPGEIRFTSGGHAVCSVTVAVNPRKFDKASGEYKDQPTQWYRVTGWRALAENMGESLSEKGLRVVVTGTLNPREYEDRDGNKRMSLDVEADEVAVSLKFATARVTKTQRTNSGGGSGQVAPVDDPWEQGPAKDSGEPPF